LIKNITTTYKNTIYGKTIKGNNGNNIGLPNGTEIPPTKVDIVRPNNLTD